MSTRHSIIGLLEILKWMEQQGYAKQALLQNTQIENARLSDPKATVLPKEELCFYRNLLRVSEKPSIVLEAGFNLKLATYGIWGLALISSPTVEKAIELGIQFVDFTYTYNDISFFTEARQAGIRITKLSNPEPELGDLAQPMIERDVSATFVLLQALLQQDKPVEAIHFAWKKTSVGDDYARLFGCPVHFDQAFTELRFPKDCLSYELPQQNVLAMQLCKEQLEQTRPQLNVEESIADKVQLYLSSTPLYRVTMEECAQGLNISSRTLRRKLDEENHSYQAILDEFRYLLSDKYLNDTRMTLEEIAERLGYSDAANFSHAYKRWAGSAPRKA